MASDIDLLAEKVMILINGGDPLPDDFKYDRRVVRSLVGNVADFAIKRDIEQKKRYADATFGINNESLLVSFKNIEVEYDIDTDEYFSELPDKPNTIYAKNAIFEVSAMQDRVNPFVKIDAGATGLFSKSKASNLEGRVGYYNDNDKLYYTVDMAELGIAKVRLKMYVNGASENSVIPSELHSQIIQETMALLLGTDRKVVDLKNDNTNNK